MVCDEVLRGARHNLCLTSSPCGRKEHLRGTAVTQIRQNDGCLALNSTPPTLADFTAPALLIPLSVSRTASGIIDELCRVLEREGRLTDRGTFYDAVLRRETLSSTSCAAGWALPHARIERLPQLCFAATRTAQAVNWFGANKALVNTVFLFAVPDREAKAYLNVVGALAKLNNNPSLVEQFSTAVDRAAMFRILQQAPLRLFQTSATTAPTASPTSLINF